MSPSNKLQIEFRKPEYGWIPTSLKYKDFELELDISDVPVDPITGLCDTLIEINKGINKPKRIIWHLEPYCYYLTLEKCDKEYKATILESEDFDGPTKITKVIHGTFEEIILPLYRSLKKFWSQSYKLSHWPEIDSSRIELLTELIKKNKPE